MEDAGDPGDSADVLRSPVDQWVHVSIGGRIVADDVTPEAVGTLLAEQNGSLSIVSAEGGLFDIIAGRYTGALNMDVWLKGHAGDLLKVDRKGRPPEYIRQPALTVALMVQPTVLDLIAAHQQFRGRGLLARFMYAFPVSKVGHRKIGPKPVSEDVREAYAQTLTTDLAKWTGSRRWGISGMVMLSAIAWALWASDIVEAH